MRRYRAHLRLQLPIPVLRMERIEKMTRIRDQLFRADSDQLLHLRTDKIPFPPRARLGDVGDCGELLYESPQTRFGLTKSGFCTLPFHELTNLTPDGRKGFLELKIRLIHPFTEEFQYAEDRITRHERKCKNRLKPPRLCAVLSIRLRSARIPKRAFFFEHAPHDASPRSQTNLGRRTKKRLHTFRAIGMPSGVAPQKERVIKLHRPIAPGGPPQRRGNRAEKLEDSPLHAPAAAEEPGNLINELTPLIISPSLGDIRRNGDELRDRLPIVPNRLNLDRNPILPAILGSIQDLRLHYRAAGDLLTHHKNRSVRRIRPLKQELGHFPPNFFQREPRKTGKTSIHPFDATRRIRNHHRVIDSRRDQRKLAVLSFPARYLLRIGRNERQFLPMRTELLQHLKRTVMGCEILILQAKGRRLAKIRKLWRTHENKTRLVFHADDLATKRNTGISVS